MGGTGNGVFVDAGGRGEETGEIVVTVVVGGGSNNHAVSQRREDREIGRQCAETFWFRDYQVRIQRGLADEWRRREAERGEQAGRGCAFIRRRGGEIEFDSLAAAARGEDSALGVEVDRIGRRHEVRGK